MHLDNLKYHNHDIWEELMAIMPKWYVSNPTDHSSIQIATAVQITYTTPAKWMLTGDTGGIAQWSHYLYTLEGTKWLSGIAWTLPRNGKRMLWISNDRALCIDAVLTNIISITHHVWLTPIRHSIKRKFIVAIRSLISDLARRSSVLAL